MAYDNSSLTGDEICDYHYDIENNFMNPPSPTGFFIYKIIGGCFDWLGDLIAQFRNDYSILDCSIGSVEIVNGFPEEPNINHTYYVTQYTTTGGSFTKYSYVDGEWVSETVTGDVLNSLDVFWGRSYNLIRPTISYTDDDTYTRVLSDEDYRIYLYLKNHQLLTMKDLLVAFGNAFGSAETSTTLLNSIHTVDHKRYDTPPFTNVTLAAYDEDDTDIKDIKEFKYIYDVLAAAAESEYYHEMNVLLLDKKFSINAVYSKKYRVYIGNFSQIDTKFKMIDGVLEDGSLEYAEKGIVDVTNPSKVSARAVSDDYGTDEGENKKSPVDFSEFFS